MTLTHATIALVAAIAVLTGCDRRIVDSSAKLHRVVVAGDGTNLTLYKMPGIEVLAKHTVRSAADIAGISEPELKSVHIVVGSRGQLYFAKGRDISELHFVKGGKELEFIRKFRLDDAVIAATPFFYPSPHGDKVLFYRLVQKKKDGMTARIVVLDLPTNAEAEYGEVYVGWAPQANWNWDSKCFYQYRWVERGRQKVGDTLWIDLATKTRVSMGARSVIGASMDDSKILVVEGGGQYAQLAASRTGKIVYTTSKTPLESDSPIQFFGDGDALASGAILSDERNRFVWINLFDPAKRVVLPIDVKTWGKLSTIGVTVLAE